MKKINRLKRETFNNNDVPKIGNDEFADLVEVNAEEEDTNITIATFSPIKPIGKLPELNISNAPFKQPDLSFFSKPTSPLKSALSPVISHLPRNTCSHPTFKTILKTLQSSVESLFTMPDSTQNQVIQGKQTIK